MCEGMQRVTGINVCLMEDLGLQEGRILMERHKMGSSPSSDVHRTRRLRRRTRHSRATRGAIIRTGQHSVCQATLVPSCPRAAGSAAAAQAARANANARRRRRSAAMRPSWWDTYMRVSVLGRIGDGSRHTSFEGVPAALLPLRRLYSAASPKRQGVPPCSAATHRGPTPVNVAPAQRSDRLAYSSPATCCPAAAALRHRQ